MESLIIPGVLLLLLCLWGVFESGRKFRKVFNARGKAWEEICRCLEQNQGVLVVDTIWGPQKGLGHPTIWWIARPITENDDLALQVENTASLVRCPRALRSLPALRGKFGQDRVIEHGWALGVPVSDAN